MAQMSRRTRIIIGALALLGALGLGFTLLRPAEEENPWEFLGPADRDVTSLVFDPTTPTTLYAATRFGDVYKSEDGGATWRYLRGSGFGGRSLAIASTTPTTLYVYGGRGVYKSADGGETWRAVNRGLELGAMNSVSALSIDPTNPRVVFAGTRNGVYKSTDGGANWRKAEGYFPEINALSIDPTNSQVIVAGASNGVYKSTDGGATWTRTWTSTGLNSKVWDVFIDPANPQVLVART